ncbi:hypothetical protein PCASD_03144 [Puccinia coronata f. sp. avenae]|uniref:Uncharacterized protein n=1 Tax=Puccinia coronata f. sp. avenae TaxID=200324 RepID=A0A2N5V5S1_9BASI|nr:hypothetical protein PCASD_03144 [Puccinia coronata f. sp. avenae]
MSPPSPTTAVKLPDRTDLRLRQGRGQEHGANLSPTSAQHYFFNLTLANTSASPSQSPRTHSLSDITHRNPAVNDPWNHSREDLLTSSSDSTIHSAGPYELDSLYNRPGASSLFQHSTYVELSIRAINSDLISTTSVPIRKNKTHACHGSFMATHEADSQRKIGNFPAPLTDYDSSPSSPSESFLWSSSNSSPESCYSTKQLPSLELDDHIVSFASSCSHLHPDDVDACVGSHPLSKSQRQAQHEFHYGTVSGLHARKASKWNRKIQLEYTRQERRRIRQLVFFAASFMISTLFLFGIILINMNHFWPVSTEPTYTPTPIIESPERTALIIYRIIGNDLPPRHSPKQTLTNLRFLLEHESNFQDISRYINADDNPDYQGSQMSGYKMEVKKFFVLNRIANQTQLSLVENVLKSHGVKDENILVNPFDTDAYRVQPFNPLPDIGWNSGLYSTWGRDKEVEESVDIPLAIEEEISAQNLNSSNRGTNSDRWRALDLTYHLKNLYAMNNNGGRNFALEHARSIPEARWILPLDGNCFFTPASLYSLVTSLRDSDLQPDPPSHVIIPMSRLLDNEQAVAQNGPIKFNKSNRQGSLRPPTRDEPQIGFRFTSKEIYSPDMRYGRRSKLELLWRLGAIDRSRNLDKKTSDWEVKEQNIITSKSYGSIQRPAQALSVSSHHREANHSMQGRPDFIRAGWVLRMFSGDQSQEKHSEKSRSRRSVNRMKGIISFLENIDELIARDSSSCDNRELRDDCGFANWRLWSLNGEALEKMKLQYIKKDSSVSPGVDKLVQLSESLINYASSVLSKGAKDVVTSSHLPEVTNAIFVLALTAYFTDNEKCADLAASLVNAVFLQSPFPSTPNAFPVALNTQLQALRLQADNDGVGYAFPIPRHERILPNWIQDTTIDYLPFNPFTFDPTLLLDGIRLLRNDWRTLNDRPQSKWLQQSLREKLPKRRLHELFTLQTSYLLLNDSITQQFFNASSNKIEWLHYAFKLSALASFTDDVRLLNRILSRSPVDQSLLSTKNSIVDSDSSNSALVFDQQVPTDFATLYRRFRSGFHNVKLQLSVDPPNLNLPSIDDDSSSHEALVQQLSYN